ncbi:nuclear transport factor 2 family protein [Nocardia thailandica]|uniref:nuclear transport factor 2 family protein n=1 Tax=Nocardia thailandica TaxID=257275 RepID=UPI0003044EB6|nr:nuclear transport factor 2 family protein [Nocardia thailandica]
MPPNPTADALLSAVLASPRAVAAHDKSAWVGLFAGDAEVNDPVGSRPHTGPAAIARFYDTFIAPNDIAFDVARDVVGGRTVVRDLFIATTMSTGATVRVPMHLRYDLAELDGSWKIVRLAAHWEFTAMVTQLMLRTGLPGLAAAARLGPQLVAHQGLSGAVGLLRAVRCVGRPGKHAAARLFSSMAVGDGAHVRALLGAAALRRSTGAELSIEELAAATRNLRWDKLIAAGRTVSASVTVDGGGGIVFVDFAARGREIVAVTLFLAEDH